MPRQSLKQREIAIAVEELQGRVGIDRAVDYFVAKGLIVADENAILEWKRDQARDFFETAKRYRRRSNEIELEPVNLFEDLPDGGRVHYYKKFGELTAAEGAQFLDYWNSRIRHGVREFYRYHGPLKRKYGSKVDQMLLFPKPAKPRRRAASC